MIAITTTVKDSLETIQNFIYYHRNIGVDYFFIFLDDANNLIFEALSTKEFSDVSCFKCDIDYWQGHPNPKLIKNLNYRQSYNANFALECCKKNNISWIAHIDIDELIYLENNVSLSFIKNLDSSVESIKFNLLEALPIKGYEPETLYDQSFFKRLPDKSVINTANEIGNKYFESWSANDKTKTKFFRGHMLSKRISRVKSWQMLSLHQSESANVKEFSGICLLHFDCPSVKKYISKMDLLLKNFGKSQVDIGRVSQEYYKIYSSELDETDQYKAKENEYYKRFIMNENDYSLFSALGLIDKIDFKQNFSPVKSSNKKDNNPSLVFNFSEIKEINKKNSLFIYFTDSNNISWFVKKIVFHLPLNQKIRAIVKDNLLEGRVNKSYTSIGLSKKDNLLLEKIYSTELLTRKLLYLAKYLFDTHPDYSKALVLRARKSSPKSIDFSRYLAKILFNEGEYTEAYELCISKNTPMIEFLSYNYDIGTFQSFVKTLSENKKKWLRNQVLKMIDNKDLQNKEALFRLKAIIE